DDDGNLWLGSDNLYRVVETDGSTSLVKEDLNQLGGIATSFGISSIYQSRDKSLWLATGAGLIRRVPDGREILYRIGSAPKDGFTSVLEDNTGRIWASRLSGIYVLVPEPLEKLTSMGALTSYDLDKIARIQANTADAVKLPERPGEIFKYTEQLANNSVKFLYRTSDDHVWIANGDGAVE